MNDRHVTIDGRKVYLRIKGNGAPVVLLHGFPQTGEAWTAVADKLAGRNRVIVPDLPGFGQSDPAVSADGGDVAALLLRALEAEGVDKFAVVGHDFGGAIAIRMALDAPERAERLVIVNAPFRKIDFKRAPHMLLFQVPVLPEIGFRLFGKQAVPWMIRAASKNKAALNAETLTRYGETLSDMRRARSALDYYRTMARNVLKRVVAKAPLMPKQPPTPGGGRRITVPTLIVWGADDYVLPQSLIPSIEQYADDATVVRLPGVGHFVPEEAPMELAHEIDRFLT